MSSKSTALPPEPDAFWHSYKPDAFLKLLRSGMALGADSIANYPNWEDVRDEPVPEGLTPEQRWFFTKVMRRQSYQPLPFMDAKQVPFSYGVPAPAIELLHLIDRNTPGPVGAFDLISNPQTRDTYLQKSLIEEAIRSGQLEGGSTPRRAAKDLILAGREPSDQSQRRIFNNYLALVKIREWKGEPLTPDRILELHSILTKGTLENEDAAGRYRRADERIATSDGTGRPNHGLPDAATLPQRLQGLSDFANGSGTGEFMHPVIRATLVVFAITHDQPFADGNGRTARALFYWVMARQGYALGEFVSISRVFRKARAQYIRALNDSVSDENDATYFVLYHLRIFARAIRELEEYLQRKSSEIKDVQARLERSAMAGADVNKRQLDVLANALKEPNAEYTIEAHRRGHDTAYATARSDLLKLAELGLLEHRKRERSFVFVPMADLHNKLHKAGAATDA